MADSEERERLRHSKHAFRRFGTKHDPKPAAQDHHSMAQVGWRMVIELVTGLIIGAGIGYGLDWLFGTIPLFLVVFTLLGFAAGVQTMLRSARELAVRRINRPRLTRASRRRTRPVAEESGGLVIKPMDQFRVEAALWGRCRVVHADECDAVDGADGSGRDVALMVFGARGRALVPSRAQSAAEMTYGFIYKMIEDVAGHDAVRFFPYIFTLFMFVLFANLLGLIPFAFTTTSHIAVTAVLAFTVFFVVTALGFILHGTKFLKLFWVSSAPLALRPVLALIEVISYFVRPVSHSIRLAGDDGGARCGQGVRGLCRCAWARFFPCRSGGDGALRAGTACRRCSGLCFHHSDLRLPERRAAPGTLRVPQGPNNPSANSNVQGETTMEGDIVQMGAYIGAGLACLGMGGAGIGVGHVAGNYLAGALRNPSAAAGQTAFLFIGIAFAEALGIFSFLVALLLMFAV